MPLSPPAWEVSTGRAERWACATFVAGVALTLAAALGVDRWAHDADVHRFEMASDDVEDRVRSRLDSYIAVVQVTQGLFVASKEVDLEEFRRFVGQLDLHQRYPGLYALGYARRLSASERAEVEAEQRAATGGRFEIWPSRGSDELYPVVFIEPASARNDAAVGFDMGSEPTRLEALERARDTGAPTATGPVTLVQEIDAEKQAGVLVCVPVYTDGPRPATTAERRVRHEGYVYAALRMGDLFADISAEEESNVAFAIADLGPPGSTELFRGPHFTDDARLQTLSHLHVAGRTWSLRTEALPELYRGSIRRFIPYVVLLGVLLSAGVAFAARSRARIGDRLRLHSRVLESMSEGVSVVDDRGVIRYTNAAEDAMFGYLPGELVGQHVSVEDALPPEEGRRLVDEILSILREKGAWSGEFSNVRKDRSVFLTSARITGLERRGEPSWICVKADITEQRRVEDERAELLERETHLRVTAEAASRAKDEFLAILGHELRNPLAPIVTALELLRRRGLPLPELAILERQARYLRRLVDDLLDVSRITRGQVVLERTRLELAHAVDLAVELATPSLEERGHSLVVEVPRWGLAIDADEGRIVQVITNLLVNAAKYTEPGGHVAVRGAREGEEVVLRVRDDGIGIGPELMPRLFDLFSQGARGADRRGGGLGIGLAVAKGLVALHGGTLVARSEGAERGSEFEVRLPTAAAAVQNLAPNVGVSLAAPIRPGLRVLVVDDNRDAAETVAKLLRSEGCVVSLAFDGGEALDLAARVRFDVAILDIGLPVMDGYELATRLPEPRPMLFAVTGYGAATDRARSVAAGFAKHFVKPVAAEALLDALAEVRGEPAR